jgi:uncharacterized membrane protein YfcA
LVLWWQWTQRRAHATSLAAVVPIAVVGSVSYWQLDGIDLPRSLLLLCGSIVGALVGSRLLSVLPEGLLRVVFAVFMLLTAVRLAFETAGGEHARSLTLAIALSLVALGLVVGVLSGLLGVGGGVFIVPALVLLFGLPPVTAKGTSLAVVIPTAVVGTISNARKKLVDLRAAAAIGCAGAVTAALGALVAAKITPMWSNALFAVLLATVALQLLVRGRRGR